MSDSERFFLRYFKRNFHRYSSYLPGENDDAEWLALMQHHGAPTRLLDWTYSFHVALFFAVESAWIGPKCAIWAVDNDFLQKMLRRELQTKFSKEERKIYEGEIYGRRDKDPRILNKLLRGEANIILGLNAWSLNERLLVQQGVFLFSQSKTEPFATTFEQLWKREPDAFRKIDIVCSKQFLEKALRTLQSINIWRVSLFPGLDGFTQSFENQLPLKYLQTYVK
ncbi:MAG: FRG domain-containing protein [Terriglobales bacterium]